jgi:hypothetical protein
LFPNATGYGAGDAARPDNLETPLFEQLAERRKRKQPAMGHVENAALAVIELPRSCINRMMRKPTLGVLMINFVLVQYFMASRRRSKKNLQNIQVLDHVKKQYAIVLRDIHGGDPALRSCSMNLLNLIFAASGNRSTTVVWQPRSLQQCAHVTAGAAEIEHFRFCGHEIERCRMRAVITYLELIVSVALAFRTTVKFAVVEYVQLVNPRFERRFDDIPSVLNSVYMTDFIAVIGRYRQLADSHHRYKELNDNFRVKMKIIGFAVKWHALKGGHRVNPVSRMKLAKIGAQQTVLAPGEDFIADEFIERHPAL